MRRAASLIVCALAALSAALPAGCKKSRMYVVVTVHDTPAGAGSLEAELELDGVPAMSRESFEAPPGGFPNPVTFVVALADDAQGILTVTVSAIDPAGCATSSGAGDAILPAEGLEVTLTPLPSPICRMDDAAVVDAGPCPDCTMPPVLRAPRQGATTGSPLVASASVASPPLRPELRWEPVFNAAVFRIQIDDSCLTPGFASCAFTSPELDEVVAGTRTRFRPASDLPVSLAPPVGRRYYWRVQVCDRDGMCSPWSEVRYVDVGRQTGDFDGDGYGDSLIGAQGDAQAGVDVGRAYVVRGGAVLPPEAALVVVAPPATAETSTLFGLALAAIGDVNADGYDDAVIGMPQRDVSASNDGAAYVYLGSPAGLAQSSSLLLSAPEIIAGGLFGSRIAGGGDLNGDGYADFAVAALLSESLATEADEGRVYVYHGGASVPTSPALTLDNPVVANPQSYFGAALALDGDLDGDGYSDLIASAPNTANGATYLPSVFVFRGGPGGAASTPVVVTSPSGLASAAFGTAAVLGDFDGDGFADVAAGAPFEDVTAVADGRVYLYPGSRAGVALTPAVILDSPGTQTDSRFGYTLGAGDLQGDGVDDLIVGASLYTIDTANEGVVFVHLGGDDGPDPIPAVTLENPNHQTASAFGGVLVVPGDLDADGRADLAVAAHVLDVGATMDVGGVFYYLGTPAGVAPTPAASYLSPPRTATDYFGGALASVTRPTDRTGALRPPSRAPAGGCRRGRGARCRDTGS